MITFETQEEFENAVMEVLAKRLEVNVDTRNSGWYSDDGKVIEVSINDNRDGCLCESSTELPVPTLKY